MKTSTLRALKASIKKWENIVAGTGVNLGAENCALCERFLKGTFWENPCEIKITGELCPVRIRSGRTGCHGTPYFPISHILREKLVDLNNVKEVQYATSELDFLKSLLPSKE